MLGVMGWNIGELAIILAVVPLSPDTPDWEHLEKAWIVICSRSEYVSSSLKPIPQVLLLN